MVVSEVTCLISSGGEQQSPTFVVTTSNPHVGNRFVFKHMLNMVISPTTGYCSTPPGTSIRMTIHSVL